MLRLDMNLVYTIINLLILYFLVKKFLFKPVHTILAKRQEEIEKQYADASAVQQKAEEIRKQYEDSVRGAAEEKAAILSEAKVKAAAEYERILDAAKQDAGKVLSDAQRAADLEQKKKIQEAQEQIADLVVAATAKLVASKASEETDRELYNQFLLKAGEQVE